MCTRPLTAFENLKGGRPIFREDDPNIGDIIELPCGKCPECQKDYYTQWATRGSRELQNWDTSVFITLTYDDDHLPTPPSLVKKDVQDFIKRLKKVKNSTKENPIRQTYCGEYGEKTKRPHYHAILYNCDFPDKRKHYKSSQGNQVYTSKQLSELWGKGFAEFGYALPSSVAYICKYILKKKTRSEKKKPYLLTDSDGCTWEVEHEFIEHSRNPGIGASIRDSESVKKGFLTVNGQKKKLPKYYMEWLRLNNPDLFDKLKQKKLEFMQSLPKEDRLRREQKENAQKLLTDTKKRM